MKKYLLYIVLSGLSFISFSKQKQKSESLYCFAYTIGKENKAYVSVPKSFVKEDFYDDTYYVSTHKTETKYLNLLKAKYDYQSNTSWEFVTLVYKDDTIFPSRVFKSYDEVDSKRNEILKNLKNQGKSIINVDW